MTLHVTDRFHAWRRGCPRLESVVRASGLPIGLFPPTITTINDQSRHLQLVGGPAAFRHSNASSPSPTWSRRLSWKAILASTRPLQPSRRAKVRLRTLAISV